MSLNNPDNYCYVCGRPEQSRYKAAPNTIFKCSICVVNEQIKIDKEEKEKAEELKNRPKKRRRKKRKKVGKYYRY